MLLLKVCGAEYNLFSREGDRRQYVSGKRKDNGQLNIRDWSSPAKGVTVAAAVAVTAATPSSSQSSSSQRSRSQLPVPVPVYCEPVTTTDSTMKVASACSVNNSLLLI